MSFRELSALFQESLCWGFNSSKQNQSGIEYSSHHVVFENSASYGRHLIHDNAGPRALLAELKDPYTQSGTCNIYLRILITFLIRLNRKK